MGVTVDIPAGTPITTPTSLLSVEDAADATALPGRTQAGFLGGTAIIEGNGTIGTGYTADSVFLEPAENILGADITSTNPVKVAGVPMVPITDARLPGDPINLRVLGGVHDPASGNVTVSDWGPTTFGTAPAVLGVNPFGLYNFRDTANFTICPASVIVSFNGATAVEGDGVVNLSDFSIFRSYFGKAPGPSGLQP